MSVTEWQRRVPPLCIAWARRGGLTTGTIANTSPQLVSVGYEGRDIDELVNALLKQGVRVLVDVRLTPISRKRGLSKTALTARLGAEGICYVHVRDLGNPKENRDAYRAGEPEALSTYQSVLASASGQRALRHVSELFEGGTVALLCFEREHGQCHRHQVVEELDALCPGLHVTYA